jgi:hypothetical protein
MSHHRHTNRARWEHLRSGRAHKQPSNRYEQQLLAALERGDDASQRIMDRIMDAIFGPNAERGRRRIR